MHGVVPVGRWPWVIDSWLLLVLLAGFDGARPTTAPPTSREIVLSTWAAYFPQETFDTFERELGVKVRSLTYRTSEDAVSSWPL